MMKRSDVNINCRKTDNKILRNLKSCLSFEQTPSKEKGIVKKTNAQDERWMKKTKQDEESRNDKKKNYF